MAISRWLPLGDNPQVLPHRWLPPEGYIQVATFKLLRLEGYPLAAIPKGLTPGCYTLRANPRLLPQENYPELATPRWIGFLPKTFCQTSLFAKNIPNGLDERSPSKLLRTLCLFCSAWTYHCLWEIFSLLLKMSVIKCNFIDELL